MTSPKRIPLHDHADRNSGGRVNASTVTQAIGGAAGSTGGGTVTIPLAEDLYTAETTTNRRLAPDGTGRVRWMSSPIPEYYITDYGAVIDDTTDDTTAWRDATLDALTHGGGAIVHPGGGSSLIAGGLLDTGAFNSQVLLPDVDHADPHIVLTYRGQLRPGLHPSYGTDISLDGAHSIVRSSLAGASGTAAVFSAGNYTPPAFNNGNNLEVNVEDLVCVAPDNPTFTFWNLVSAQAGAFRDLQMSTPGGFAGSAVQPTHANAYGIKLPAVFRSNYTRADGLSVGGFYTGVLNGERAIHDGLILGICIVGLEQPQMYFASLIKSMQITSFQYAIRASGGMSRLDILDFSAEHTTSPAWMVTVADLDDASNLIHGLIRHQNAVTGGTLDPTFTKIGGANVLAQEKGPWWGAGAALTIKEEGTPLATDATSIDFVGAGVVASGAGAAKTVTIAGSTTYDTDGLISVYPGAYSVAGDPPVVTLTSVWGVTGGGVPYYNAANVVAGEEAALYYNPSNDEFVLVPYGF